MFVSLSEKDIDQVLELQDIVYNSLADDKKNYIVPKNKEKMLVKLSQGSYMDGKLVAQSFILNPSIEFPDTGMVDMQDQGDVAKGITILQGVIVHPDYQGQGLGHKMIHHWIEEAAKSGKDTALAEVEVHNYKSYGGFLHAGLEIVSIGVDPLDGCEVFNIKGNPQKAVLNKEFNSCAANCNNGCINIPADNVSSIKVAFNNNYKAVYWDKNNKQLVMSKNCTKQLSLQGAI